jgi:two-component system, response regulator PdtaR
MMPHTSDALVEDVWAQHLGPPQPAAAVDASAEADPARWDRPGRDFVAIARSFESVRTASATSVVPVANLPRRPKVAAPRSVPQSHDAGGRALAVPPMRVVVVEDDAIIGTLLAEMLADMGHDVCAIETTEADAVSAAARCKPDLMIVDVGLAEGSGISAIEKIHLTGPVPHVFVSGDVSRVRALRPSSIFIQKPYRESDLARVIQEALDAAPFN